LSAFAALCIASVRLCIAKYSIHTRSLREREESIQTDA